MFTGLAAVYSDFESYIAALQRCLGNHTPPPPLQFHTHRQKVVGGAESSIRIERPEA